MKEYKIVGSKNIFDLEEKINKITTKAEFTLHDFHIHDDYTMIAILERDIEKILPCLEAINERYKMEIPIKEDKW